ncbi:hypothetical protein FRACA_10095 [Frankia canadensis]|uniref:Uncharacterized protein n=1 Tax=Frankia canadensis TaxID=1836972 RepID=A0A2I2KI42_9ACTN|nr:hypothetical protein [Frankia canadensis]SNQ45335.1 hypothetical protein FRACA_10095 [Frankia canadensis]SOU52625.1 hypothetical protein FRACA_10095 [Frankia canadensis]
MPVQMQRMRIAPGALEDVRAWLKTAGTPGLIAAHRELRLWVEHCFLVEDGARTYLFNYLELDEPETLGERATAITEPAFVELRGRFRGWFDEVVIFAPDASVVATESV